MSQAEQQACGTKFFEITWNLSQCDRGLPCRCEERKTDTKLSLPACIFYPLTLLYFSSSSLSLLSLIYQFLDSMLTEFLPHLEALSKYLLNEEMNDPQSFGKVAVRFCKLGMKTSLSWSILSGHEINKSWAVVKQDISAWRPQSHYRLKVPGWCLC